MNRRIPKHKIIQQLKHKCPKCGNYLQVKEHNLDNPIVLNKLSSQKIFYSKWLTCSKCSFVFYNNKYKKYSTEISKLTFKKSLFD